MVPPLTPLFFGWTISLSVKKNSNGTPLNPPLFWLDNSFNVLYVQFFCTILHTMYTADQPPLFLTHTQHLTKLGKKIWKNSDIEKHVKEYENVLTLWPWISWVDAGPGAQIGRTGPRPVYIKEMIIKGTVRPDWIYMRVVSLESPLKGNQPL